MGLGAIVDAEDFRPWLHDARINGEIGDYYWGRYRRLLNLKELSKSVIDVNDEVTDRVLDRLGDTKNMSAWSGRGMVVGHVQNGKTANHTGLICKAADAGYRLIVVNVPEIAAFTRSMNLVTHGVLRKRPHES